MSDQPILHIILPNVVVVLARCSQTSRVYGIRIEEKAPAQWHADWAFSIPEQRAQKEGYDQSSIRGTFEIDDEYPGCPHCHNASFFRCRCGKVGCWDQVTRKVTCPWCELSLNLGGSISDLTAGADR
jgi:hypothetical protein